MKQKKLNILIRTAGGTDTKEEIGFGHVYRCANLASYLIHHNIFFLLEDYGGAKKILNSKGYRNIVVMKKDLNINYELKKTISYIRKKKIDVLIIDRYNIRKIYVSKIRQYVKTVLISDLLNVNYDVDLLINGFIGLKNYIKKNRYGSRCLLGPKYQILDKKFSRPQLKSNKEFNLLVTLGGFDKNDIIKIILKLLTKIKPIKSKIILGPGTPMTNEIKSFSQQYKYLQIKQKTNDMRNDILNAKFGICSGGITTYEFATLRVPFAIVCQAKHQLVTAKRWQQKGIALNLGLTDKNIEKRIRKVLEKLLAKRPIYRGRKTVDGQGSRRVADEIIKLSKNT